jgi:hypothetical protein
MCFGLCFADVMYREHILAQYNNMWVIAKIDGDRKEWSGLF